MTKQNFILNLSLILTMTLLSCETKREIDCGYNGTTIQGIYDQEAFVRDMGYQFFLHFEDGIKINPPSSNLLDTIYLLLPCNLPDIFKVDSQKVRISGEIKENPGYSSHDNYTDFYIHKISKY
jgi:hypothetical protein